MRIHSTLLFALTLFLLATISSHATDRVAFIVGNDAYPSVPLDNAVRDATAIKEMLRTELNFGKDDVIFATNTDRIGFFEHFEKFKKSAARADIVLVYYAGHGMESLDGKENFIIPVDADVKRAVESEAALRATGINLMTLSADLADASNGAKIVLMDCCRQRPAGRDLGNRSGGGLNTYEDKRIPADTLMILAAAPNRIASDGAKHGPFTEALLEILPKGGQNLMDAFFDVSDRVQEVTQKSQVPWLKFDGSGKIFRDQAFLAVAAVPGVVTRVPMKPAPPKPTTVADRIRGASIERPFVNSLGMEFIPVPGKPGVLMCRTETRVRDFRAFADDTDFVPKGGSFVMNLSEVEQGNYRLDWELLEDVAWDRPGFSQTEDHPVVCVSWEEAVEFCEWLSDQESGVSYRLPSDTEWSAAVGLPEKYPWGNEWPPPKGAGNYAGTEKNDELPGSGWETAYDYSDGNFAAARVSSFRVNRFGFYDLGGNVWEWCRDQYRSSMNDSELFVLEPVLRSSSLTSSDGKPYRVMRGGSWSKYKEYLLRSSYRNSIDPTLRGYDVGFRLVLTVGSGS